jgi:hypothetical protein
MDAVGDAKLAGKRWSFAAVRNQRKSGLKKPAL